MRFRHELRYDAPPDRVFAMLADPAFRRSVAEAMDVISADVDLQPAGDGFTLTVDQLQRTDDLPSFARTFAGDSTQAIQRETWVDRSGGSLEIEAPGKPTHVSGTITLLPDGTGTKEVVDLEIKVKVPLVGGKLEKLMAEKVKAGMDQEHAVGIDYLKENGA
jgi:carbon monoxide dehydrogenase subunit G